MSIALLAQYFTCFYITYHTYIPATPAESQSKPEMGGNE